MMVKSFPSRQSLSMGVLGSIASISLAFVAAKSNKDQQFTQLSERHSRVFEARFIEKKSSNAPLSWSPIGSEFDTNETRSKHGELKNPSLSSPAKAKSFYSNLQSHPQSGPVERDAMGRRLQDTNCPMELLHSVEGDDDGFLTLTEYHNFFSNRYYRRCDLSDVDVYTLSGIEISVAQTETFNSLSCLICLGEMSTPISSLPECCRAENARIALDNPTAGNFARICEDARATAIEECGYVAVIETIAPLPPMQSQPSPPVPAPMPPPPPSPVQPNGGVNQKCAIDLMDADRQVIDGLLDQTEFLGFLETHFGADCMSNVARETLTGVFRQLACAWCLSANGASLECCVGSAARVSISEASVADGQASNSIWLGRICSTVANEIGSACGMQSPTLLPLVQPSPVPVSSPLSSPVVPPISFAPIRTPNLPVQAPAASPMDTPLTESPSSRNSPIPTPDPTLRPPPGNPIGALTTPPTKPEEPSSEETNTPTQSVISNPPNSSVSTNPTVSTSQPAGGPPRTEPNDNSSAHTIAGFLTGIALLLSSCVW